MKFVYSQEFQSVYWKLEDGTVMYTQVDEEGKFDTEEGGAVENWDDLGEVEKVRVLKALN